MKTYLFIISLFISLSSYSQREIIIDEPFHEIKIYNKIEAVLIPASENKIIAKGYDKEKIDAKVKNGVLHIKLSLSNIWSEDDTQVKIYFTEIQTVDANEGSQIELQDINQPNLTLKAQEGSQIYGKIEVKSLYIKSVTGSIIRLSGSTESQAVEVRTGGQFLADNFISKTADVDVKAGGEVEIYVTETFKGKVTAGGSIEVEGNPKNVSTKKSLGGDIIIKKNDK